MHVGVKIAKIRELKNLKQSYIASKLGISQQAYSKIERYGKINDAKLYQIAVELGCSVNTINNFSEDKVSEFLSNLSDNL